MSNAVIDCLEFARRRLADLHALGDEGLMKKQLERQQLTQEFFFDLVASIQFLAQEVNGSRNLGFQRLEVLPHKVSQALHSGDCIGDLLRELHPKTPGEPLPEDPYSDEGMHFRVILTRNFVCHVGTAPYFFRFGGPGPEVSLWLDLREERPEPSRKAALVELNEFHRLVDSKCKHVLRLL